MDTRLYNRIEKRLLYLGFHHLNPYSIKYQMVIAHHLRKQLSFSLILQTDWSHKFRSTDILTSLPSLLTCTMNSASYFCNMFNVQYSDAILRCLIMYHYDYHYD